ncbi:hypothetical protein GM418_00980 [Maribellus comscasis]|uniref:Uncharacterized protein n=1 Tax=Maribellus comscasis TaxID=2681766 RepID=A0A6I6JMJ2_9BACT|nr:hypothetical protein [Maribellus comscasis]QGY42278.1 hypothetical protein GM418_00980 [Maribellus comscasis]
MKTNVHYPYLMKKQLFKKLKWMKMIKTENGSGRLETKCERLMNTN